MFHMTNIILKEHIDTSRLFTKHMNVFKDDKPKGSDERQPNI